MRQVGEVIMAARSVRVRRDIVAWLIALMSASHLEAQTYSRKWSGPAELSEWKRVGYALGSTPRDARGIAITVDPDNAPHILRSPRLNIPAKQVRALRILYSADYGDLSAPAFVVGAITDRRGIENVRGCGITVPVSVQASHMVEVGFAASACWDPDATIQQIDINVDGSQKRAQPGVVRIHSIEIVGM